MKKGITLLPQVYYLDFEEGHRLYESFDILFSELNIKYISQSFPHLMENVMRCIQKQNRNELVASICILQTLIDNGPRKNMQE